MLFENEQNNNNQDQNTNENQNNSKSCCQELNDYKNKALYMTAEFENYKRRTEKEKIQWLFDGENLVLKNLLTIIDDFERAFNALKNQQLEEVTKTYFQGFELTYKSFEKILSKFGVEEVKYNTFDPEFHEAVMQVKSDKHQAGQIVDVFQKGYLHKGKLLRPAQVSIAE